MLLIVQAKTSITTFPSSAEIVPEPFGVVLIISPWNYPFCMLDILVNFFFHILKWIKIAFLSDLMSLFLIF